MVNNKHITKHPFVYTKMIILYLEIKKQILTMVTTDQEMRKGADKIGVWNYGIDKKILLF